MAYEAAASPVEVPNVDMQSGAINLSCGKHQSIKQYVIKINIS
jgi:hypothetical protein